MSVFKKLEQCASGATICLHTLICHFILQVKRSEKNVLRTFLRKIENDCLSTTGRNFKALIEWLILQSSNSKVHLLQWSTETKRNEWMIVLVDEINNSKSGDLEVSFQNLPTNFPYMYLRNPWPYQGQNEFYRHLVKLSFDLTILLVKCTFYETNQHECR